HHYTDGIIISRVMTELIDEVLFYLDHNPVLPPLVCLYCIICSIPVVILLIATQNCAIHRNCRYLISLWSLSLIGFLVNVASLYLEMLTFDNGYLPRNLIDPPLRRYFLAVHSMFYVCSSSFEMYIALERIVSTRQPHAYHVREEHWTRLVPVTIATYIFGAYVGYLIYIIDNHLTGLLIYNAIDISTLVINKFGIYYCKRRYNALYGKASLNARYQGSEAYRMTSAMHPVYCASFCIKIIALVIAYVYVFVVESFSGQIYGVMEAGYFMFHCINCAFSSSFLIMKNDSIRGAVSEAL
ncbi:hypothetical protein PFISCL1PPCAC_14399, partial [Pristionchus fissidentatus]